MKDFCCGARVGKWQILQKYSGSPTRARVANDFRQTQIVSWDSPAGDQRRRMKFYQSCHLSDRGATFTTKSARCGVAASRSDYCGTYPAATAVPQPLGQCGSLRELSLVPVAGQGVAMGRRYLCFSPGSKIKRLRSEMPSAYAEAAAKGDHCVAASWTEEG